jgi:hypothetical protein
MVTRHRLASQIEGLAVFFILATVATIGGCKSVDLLSALASLLTFLCTQTAFDMTEQLQALQSQSQTPDNKYRALFIAKESVWILTCLALGSLPLLASTGVFASYPIWRRRLRSRLSQRQDLLTQSSHG